jgi:hypothetical protein
VDELAEFLRDRLNEDAEMIWDWPPDLEGLGPPPKGRFWADTAGRPIYLPLERMTAQIDTFREILRDYEQLTANPHRMVDPALHRHWHVVRTLCLRLAGIWAAHPDYRVLVLAS